MGCVIKYKNKSIPEEQFLQYLKRQVSINDLFNSDENFRNSVYEALGFDISLPSIDNVIESENKKQKKEKLNKRRELVLKEISAIEELINTKPDEIIVYQARPYDYYYQVSEYFDKSNWENSDFKYKDTIVVEKPSYLHSHLDEELQKRIKNLQVINSSLFNDAESVNYSNIFKEGNSYSSKEILEYIINNKKDVLSGIAEHLLKYSEKNNVEVKIKPEEKRKLGSYFGYPNYIEIYGKNGITSHTLIHEIVHSLSTRYIYDNPNSIPVLELKNILKNILDKKILKEYKNNERDYEDYATKNIHELLSEIISRPDILSHLSLYDTNYNLIKGKHKQKSILDSVIKILSDIFNFSKKEAETLTDLILFNAKDIFEASTLWNEFNKSQITPQQKQQALQQYSAYLDSVFPNSKVKDIVYHGTRTKEEFEKFITEREYPIQLPHLKGKISKGSFFTKDKNIADVVGIRTITAILNMKNPLYRNKGSEYLFKEDVEDIQKNNDSLIAPGNKEEFIVFEPEQIHILGGKQDIEGFKAFNKNSKPAFNLREQIITEIATQMSYTIEINTAKSPVPNYKGEGIENTTMSFEYNGYKYITDGGMYIKKSLTNEDDFDSVSKKEFNELREKYINDNKEIPTQIHKGLSARNFNNVSKYEGNPDWEYQELKIQVPQVSLTSEVLKHNPFNEPQTIAHSRVQYNDKTKTVEVQEFQSDPFQDNKQQEFKDENSAKQYVEQLKDTYNDVSIKKINDSTWKVAGRERKDLTNYYTNPDKPELGIGKIVSNYNDGTVDVKYKNGFDYEVKKSNLILVSENKDNKFLQLLNKNDVWITVGLKSLIQDSAKKGYEKVLFPVGDTAAKIEGHETVQGFIDNKENRIKELEQSSILKNKTVDGFYYIQRYLENENGEEVLTWRKVSNDTGREKTATKEEIEDLKTRFSDETKNEIQQLEKEIADAKAGKLKISSIASFYENTIYNVLVKNYGKENVNRITDEYGNGWYELNLDSKRDEGKILFQSAKAEYTGDIAIEEKIMEMLENSSDEILPNTAIGKFVKWLKEMLGSLFQNKSEIEEFIKSLNQGKFKNKEIDKKEELKSKLKNENSQIVPNGKELNLSEKDLQIAYENYIQLMDRKREGKSIDFKKFKQFFETTPVFKYKNTYILGEYDKKNNVFKGRLMSSPGIRELYSGLDELFKLTPFMASVPEDLGKMLDKKGLYKLDIGKFFNFRGEDMIKNLYFTNKALAEKVFNKPINKITKEDVNKYDSFFNYWNLLKKLENEFKKENFDNLFSILKEIGIYDYNAYKLIKKAKTNKITKDDIDTVVKEIIKNSSVNRVQVNKADLINNSELYNNLNNELNKTLATYLSKFGIKTELLSDIQDKLGIDSFAHVDILNKIIYAQKDNQEDYPQQAGKVIAYMMQYNPLISEITSSMKKSSMFKHLSKDELFEAVGDLIAQELHNKTNTNLPKSLIDNIKNLIKQFFDFLFTVKINRINKNIGIIADNILLQNQSLITESTFKPGAVGEKVIKVSLEDALKKDSFANSIVNKMSDYFILTGSIALSEQGDVLRPDENQVHDLDWVSPFSQKETKKIFEKLYPKNETIRVIEDNNGYKTNTWVIAPEGYTINNLKLNESKSKIEGFDIIADNTGNVVSSYIPLSDSYTNKKIQAKLIDIFSSENYEEDRLKSKDFKLESGKNLQLASWRNVYKAKLEYARLKDIWDYNRFVPNEYLEENNPNNVKEVSLEELNECL